MVMDPLQHLPTMLGAMETSRETTQFAAGQASTVPLEAAAAHVGRAGRTAAGQPVELSPGPVVAGVFYNDPPIAWDQLGASSSSLTPRTSSPHSDRALSTPPTPQRATPRRGSSAKARAIKLPPSPSRFPLLPLETLLAVGTIVWHGNVSPLMDLDDPGEWQDFAPALFEDNAGDKFIEDLGAMQAIRVVRATFRHASPVVFRLYLSPSDLDDIHRREPSNELLARMLQRVRASRSEWETGCLEEGDVRMLLSEEGQHRSFLDIYEAIQSPASGVEWIEKLGGATRDVKALLEDTMLSNPVGMRTTLHRYQRASVAKMIAREQAPQMIPDPTYQRYRTVDERDFFVQVAGHRILQAPPQCRDTRGGILSEVMGAGKTIIALALVLSTQGELPLTERVVETPLSAGFPFQRFHDLRLSLRDRVPPLLEGVDDTVLSVKELREHEAALVQQARDDEHANDTRLPLPSLGDILLHKLRCQSSRHDLPPGICSEKLLAATPFYHVPNADVNARRRARVAAPIKFVSSATLIVVPGELLLHWQSQLKEHFEVELKVRVIHHADADEDWPSSEELAQYDIVLMSVAHFTGGGSVLRGVHWLRLVVDEGHTLANANELRTLCSQLLVQSRWSVSATPANVQSRGDETALAKLGQILNHFLLFPFHSPNSFNHSLAAPFKDKRNPRGAARIAALLGAVVVRNQPSDLSYNLPPLTVTLVKLSMTHLERLTYNSILALFTVNSVLTQREDGDYFFHPTNRKALQAIVSNLSASAFFHVGENAVGLLSEALANSRKALESNTAQTWSEEDRVSLHAAVASMAEAHEDDEWARYVNSLTVSVEVKGFATTELDGMFEEFHARPTADATVRRVPLDKLVILRGVVTVVRREPGWRDEEELVEEIITFEAKRARLVAGTMEVDAQEDGQPKSKPSRKKSHLVPPRPFPPSSELAQLTISLTSSAKLNYIVQQLARFPDDKFLIFSSVRQDTALSRLSETFDLLGITHALFVGGRDKDRGTIAERFNASSAKECQVLLLNASIGGRGIELISASRIVFIEPIWSSDLESQALSRAWRQGQTRPVRAEILVIEDGWDDSIWKRKESMSLEERRTVAAQDIAPERDASLSALLRHARYLPAHPQPRSEQHERLLFDDQLIRTTAPLRISSPRKPPAKKRAASSSSKGSSPKKPKMQSASTSKGSKSTGPVRFLDQ